MGLDAEAVLSKNRGGAPHQLPKLLAALDKADADVLRDLFRKPFDAVDHTELRRQLSAIDPTFLFSPSTLRRWHEDYQLNPKRFDGAV